MLLGLMAAFWVSAQAQDTLSAGKKNESIILYLNGGIGGGTGFSHNYGISFLNKKKIGFEVNYHSFAPKAQYAPPDYLNISCLFFCYPKDRVNVLSGLFKKRYQLRKKKFQYEWAAGLAYVRVDRAYFEKEDYSPLNGGWYYNVTRKNLHTVGLTAKTGFALLPSELLGFDISVFACLSPVQTVAGIAMNCYLGQVR